MREGTAKGRRRARWMAPRWRKAVVAIVLGGLTLVAAAGVAGPEYAGPLSLAQYVPFPAWLAPALLALAGSLALGWRWRLAAGAGLALVLAPIMGLSLAPERDEGPRVRLMTYNIKAYYAVERPDGFAAIAAEIARHDPDLLVLQDARELGAARLADPALGRAVLGDRAVYAYGQYIVASRHPIRDCAPGSIGFRDRAHTFVSCVVRVKGVDIDLLTVHLLTPRHGLNATRAEWLGGLDEWLQNVDDRLEQAEALAANVRQRTRPVVLAGDLNAPPRSLVLRHLKEAGLRDAFAQAGLGYGYSYGHSLKPRFSFLRIDHVLAGRGIGVADCRVGGPEGSTHRPVIADLVIEGAAA